MCNPPFPPPCSSSTFDPLSSSPSSSSYSNNNSYSSSRLRKPSLRSIAGSGTTQRKQRSPLFFDDEDSDHEEPHYFLDSCFLCKTPLRIGDDIYMYRGDTPFCTEECRQEQIEIDEARERKNKHKNKLIKSQIENSTITNSKSHEIEIIIHGRAAA